MLYTLSMKKFLSSYGLVTGGLLCILLFYCIGSAVRSNSGALFALDLLVQDWALSLRSWEMTRFMTLVTNLAVGKTLSIVYGLTLVVFLMYRQWKPVVGTALGFWPIQYFTDVLKDFFLRVRPEDMLGYASGWSYPSGHTTGSTIVLLFIVYGFCRILKLRYLRVITIIMGIAAMLLIGLSRVYLNVHWFSDVYGAYLLCVGVFLIILQVLSWQMSAAKKRAKIKA